MLIIYIKKNAVSPTWYPSKRKDFTNFVLDIESYKLRTLYFVYCWMDKFNVEWIYTLQRKLGFFSDWKSTHGCAAKFKFEL